MNPFVQTQYINSRSPQKLRNVPVSVPTIMWVQKGRKELLRRDEMVNLDPSYWLVVHANQHLTFLNIPEETLFQSKCVSFFLSPPEEMLVEGRLSSPAKPRIKRSQALDYGLEVITSQEFQKLPQLAQKQFIYGFYALLNEAGILRLLFPQKQATYAEKVFSLIGNNPGQDFRLENVAQGLSMSRATLARKLDSENTSFRQILRETRMTFALSLLQDDKRPIDVALACGYKSEARFASQFKKQFGLSPRGYLATVR
ncbi:helix-turn-helix transcriptional regulator [Curvivirga sp.]|uniref:AraC family transcriptional regulator n=1 Tax=Curvivirga sp. TaxID=2856848 RepID=UPI003B5CCD75